jgi:tetratricopeptide (TPR) repeat protein
MMKKPLTLIFSVLISSTPILAKNPEARSDPELLHARRILEFWRDQETEFTRSEIQKFFQEFPSSEFCDTFYAILGDMALREKAQSVALNFYCHIKDPEIIKSIKNKRWRALYELEEFALLYQEIAPQLPFIKDDEGLFYFAEAAYREALTLSDEDEMCKNRLLCEALNTYKLIEPNPIFKFPSQFARADIFRLQGDFEKAAFVYQEIAQLEKSPEIQFKSAHFLLQCQHEQAASEIFCKLAKGGSNRSAESAFQWMQLLAKNRNWDLLKKERRLFLCILQPSHLPVYHFYMAMLSFEEGLFLEASMSLQDSLKGGLKPPYDKSALLALLSCAKELSSFELTEFCLPLVKARYPDELEEALFIHAICYKRSQNNQKALEIFNFLAAKSVKNKIREESFMNKIELEMACEAYLKAHDSIHTFLSLFPDSSYIQSLTKLAVSLSLKSIQSENMLTTLVEDAQRAIKLEGLSKEESTYYKLILSKCLLKQDKSQLALEHLNEIMQQGHESADLHYLMTLAYVKSISNPEKVIFHGERALTSIPSSEDKDRLHLYLFNACLELSQKQDNYSLTKKAADHLFSVIEALPVSLENQLWLANFYAQDLDTEEKALQVYENILCAKSERSLQYPTEALTLCHLYLKHNTNDLVLKLTQPLVEKLNLVKAKLLQGVAYQQKGLYEQAYPLLTECEKQSDPFISRQARLSLARLLYPQAQTLNQQEVALGYLKDLWVKKDLATEPLHLEAAYDYLQIKEQTLSIEELLALALRIKEYFSSESDLQSKDYHQQRMETPQKNRIYQAYMRLLDAKIYSLMALQPHVNIAEAAMQKKAARALYSSLICGKYNCFPYVVNQALSEGG